jgi:large subunit ribosomal protein L29
MLADEIRKLSADEIENRLDDAREELLKLRFQVATGELSDTSRLRATRKLIARLITVLSEVRQAEATGGAA